MFEQLVKLGQEKWILYLYENIYFVLLFDFNFPLHLSSLEVLRYRYKVYVLQEESVPLSH